MKIFKDKEVYVQAYDLAQINNYNAPHPSTLLTERFNNNDYDAYLEEGRIFLKFSDPIEVEYFKMLDWIIDYNDIKDKSLQELDAIYNKLNKMKTEKYNSFINKSGEERQKASREYSNEMRRLYNMAATIEIIRAHKQKYINIKFPFNIEETYNDKPVIKKKAIKKEVK